MTFLTYKAKSYSEDCYRLSIDTLTSTVCKKEMHGRYLIIGGVGRIFSLFILANYCSNDCNQKES